MVTPLVEVDDSPLAAQGPEGAPTAATQGSSETLTTTTTTATPRTDEGAAASDEGAAASDEGAAASNEGATASDADLTAAAPSSPDSDWEELGADAGDDGEPVCALTLLTLPPELLLTIMEYLDVGFVVRRLSLVCKKLQRLVTNAATWKIRISKRWPKLYPITPVDDEAFNWQHACMQRESQHRLWSDAAAMEHFSLGQGHFGEIDSVHLMQGGDLCISGSRDRSFHLWDLRRLDSRDPEESAEAARLKSVQRHKGWVWHITSRDNIACTASWDKWIRLWDMQADCAEVRGFRGNSAFLCSVLHQHEVHASAYDKHVYIFDRRDRNQEGVSKLRLHQMPVLSLASDDQYIISASEDKTVAIFDRRAGQLLKKVELEKFPMCMSYGLGQLWVGRKDGKISVIDPAQGKFDLLQTYDVGHTSKVTGILHSLGSVITCSTDHTIKIHEPNHEPSIIRTINDAASFSAIHTCNDVLAAGGSDLCVRIWRPAQQLAD